MIKELKTVFFWLVGGFFDVFEDPIRLKIIDDIKANALGIKQEADYYYDNECIAVNGEYSNKMKNEINRLVDAYNHKASDYNNKSYWYKPKLKPVPHWG